VVIADGTNAVKVGRTLRIIVAAVVVDARFASAGDGGSSLRVHFAGGASAIAVVASGVGIATVAEVARTGRTRQVLLACLVVICTRCANEIVTLRVPHAAFVDVARLCSARDGCQVRFRLV
jgi:hypothetical protein